MNKDPNVLKKDLRFNFVRRMLLYLSVTDLDILAKAPKRSVLSQEILGVSVLLTAVFAGLSATYAFSTVFNSPFVFIPLGLLWGLVVMNVDRQLVSSFKVSITDSDYSQFVQGILLPILMRIPIALVLGFIISVPLELRIFNQEISNYLKIRDIQRKEFLIAKTNSDYTDEAEQIFADRSPRILSLEQDLIMVEKEISRYDSLMNQNPDIIGEMTTIDTITTRKAPVRIQSSNARIYQNERNKAQKRYEALFDSLSLAKETKSIGDEKLITQLKAVRDERLEKLESERDDLIYGKKIDVSTYSLMSRYIALQSITHRANQELQISNDSYSALSINNFSSKVERKYASQIKFGLRVAIILMELLPVIIKILTRNSRYEQLIQKDDLEAKENLKLKRKYSK